MRNRSWRRKLGRQPHTRRDISELQLSVSKWFLVPLLLVTAVEYPFGDRLPLLLIPFCLITTMSFLAGTGNRLYSHFYEGETTMNGNKLKQLAQKAFNQRDKNPEIFYDKSKAEFKEPVEYQEHEVVRCTFYRDKSVSTDNDEDIEPQPRDRVAFYNSHGEKVFEIYREELDLQRISGKGVRNEGGE